MLPQRNYPPTILHALDDLLRFWPVSKAVNAPRNNGPELLKEQAATPGGDGGPNPA